MSNTQKTHLAHARRGFPVNTFVMMIFKLMRVGAVWGEMRAWWQQKEV